MANYDNPDGFAPVGVAYGTNEYTASATIAKGDALAIVSGEVLPYAIATHDLIVGVAAEAAAANETLLVWDDPRQEFQGQCSGTYAATMNGERLDIEGTTGIMEVNENATVKTLVALINHYPIPGSEDIGANSRVRFKIAKHQLVADANLSATQSMSGTLSVDTIAEYTGAAGVTADGALLKDGGGMDVVTRINKHDNSASGYGAVIDVAAATAADLTDNSGGTPSTTIADITEANNAGSADRVPTEDAIASLAAQTDALVVDVALMRTAINGILANLRVTGGAGVIAD